MLNAVYVKIAVTQTRCT